MVATQAASSPAEGLSGKLLWRHTPSQWVNAPRFIRCALGFILVLVLVGVAYRFAPPNFASGSAALLILALWPLGSAFQAWLRIHTTRYELTTERIFLSQGVFNTSTCPIELYHVRDYIVSKPFFLRLFGLGSLFMPTSDLDVPMVRIDAVPEADRLEAVIRHHVELCRVAKGVREIDAVDSRQIGGR